MLRKTIFRTIRSSLGRYVAILAIIALGVGFFAGLRVTEATMLATADGYIKELNLYDFRLISTLGLTDEDASAFAELSGVETAAGSVSSDAIFVAEDGSDAVFHTHSLLDGMNGLDVLQGRLPKTATECVIDARYVGASGVLGKEIVLSESNSQETMDVFAQDQYTVVGIVDSSEYINFQRGTTALAGGTVLGYLYILPDGYCTDYYTEIYLDVSTSGAIFSEEYKASIDAVSEQVEALLTERGDIRYETIYNDAKTELDDAQSQLDEKVTELNDAQKEVDDGWETYRTERSDAEKKLRDAKKQLSDARAQLDNGWKALEDAKKAPASSIPEIKTQLDAQEKELQKQEQLYKTNLAAYEKAYKDAYDGFAKAEQDLKDGQAEIDAGLALLEQKKAELAAAQQEITSGWETYRTERANIESQLSQNKAQLDAARIGLDSAWAALEAARQAPNAQLPEIKAQLDAQEAALQAQETTYAANLAAYEQAYNEAIAGFAATEQTLNATQAEIDAGKAQLEQSATALTAAQQGIDSGWTAYRTERAAAEQTLTETKTLLDSARSQLDAGWKALEEAKNAPAISIPEIKAQLDAQEKTLSDGEKTYKTNLSDYEKAYEDAYDGFAEAEKELKDGQSEIDKARPEIADAQKEIDDGRSELAELKPATVYALDRSSNFGYASFENDIAIVSGVAKVFPLFFFLVAALVCITTMTRMVSEQRTHNGVLKAMGYSNSAVVSQYLVYAGSASVFGCIFGFLLGSKFMPMVLWEVYHIMYTIDRPAVFVLDWGLFAGCSLLYLGCALGATWMVCHKDLQESAAQLIRPKAPEAGKRVFLERVGFIWKRLKFLHKVSIRNILLYKKRMVMMMIGVGGCMALLLAGFGIRDTIKPIVSNQYGQISLYDAAVSFMEAPTDAQKLEFLTETENIASHKAILHSGNVDVMIGNTTVSSGLVVYDEDISALVDLHADETKVSWPEVGEAVVNYRFAEENGLNIGDTVQLCDSDYRSMTVTISGIYDNYIGDTIYVSQVTCLKSWGYAPEVNTAWLRFAQGQDENEASAKLLNMDNVASITLTSDFKEMVENMLSSMDYIVLIVLVCAGALAFIVLYNLTNITITERIREIATLKVLGFTVKEQNAYVFRENLILTALSSLFGIPFGIFLLRYVMSQIKISTFYFGCRLAPLSYVWAIGLTFAFTFFVDKMLTVKMKRINMAEALKTIE